MRNKWVRNLLCYNDENAMVVRVWIMRYLPIGFGWILILGLVSTSNLLFMPNMQMDHSRMSHSEAGEVILTSSGSPDHQSSVPCCGDTIHQCNMVFCAFVIPQGPPI